MRVGLFAVVALIAMASTEASTQVLNLSGPYRCVQGCVEGLIGQPAFITQNGWDMRLVNEAGDAIPSMDRSARSHLGRLLARRRSLFCRRSDDPIRSRDRLATRSRCTGACRANSFRGASSVRRARPSGQCAPGPKCKNCSDSVRKSARRDQCLRRPLERGHSGANWRLWLGISLRRTDQQRQHHHGRWRIH